MADVQLRQTYPAPQSPTVLKQPEQEGLLEGDGELKDGLELPAPESSKRVIKEERAGDSAFYIVTFVGLLTFLLSTWYLALSTSITGKREWFVYHPTYQSLGIALMVMGIQTLQPTATPPSKKAGLDRHQVIQIGALLTLTAGTGAIVLNKLSHNAPHLISWHAYMGVVAYAWLCMQSAMGVASVWWKGRAFGGMVKAKRMWKWHRISGYALLLWMLGTAFLAGEWSGWARTFASPIYRAVGFGTSLVLVAVGVLGRTRVSKMRFW